MKKILLALTIFTMSTGVALSAEAAERRYLPDTSLIKSDMELYVSNTNSSKSGMVEWRETKKSINNKQEIQKGTIESYIDGNVVYTLTNGLVTNKYTITPDMEFYVSNTNGSSGGIVQWIDHSNESSEINVANRELFIDAPNSSEGGLVEWRVKQ